MDLGIVNTEMAIEVWEWMKSHIEFGIVFDPYLIAILNPYHMYKKCFSFKIKITLE